MMKRPKNLIIIPGVGDDHFLYHIGARWFGLFGFTCYVHTFGWNSADPASYAERLRKLVDFAQSLEGSIYMLGVSAGGPTSVNCYAALPEKVAKVATLCSPLAAFKRPVNPLLEVAISDTTQNLTSMSQETKQKILSLHAVYDQVVPVNLSRIDGVQQKTLFSFWHVPSIVLGLTIFSLPIMHFFKQR